MIICIPFDSPISFLTLSFPAKVLSNLRDYVTMPLLCLFESINKSSMHLRPSCSFTTAWQYSFRTVRLLKHDKSSFRLDGDSKFPATWNEKQKTVLWWCKKVSLYNSAEQICFWWVITFYSRHYFGESIMIFYNGPGILMSFSMGYAYIVILNKGLIDSWS